MNPEAEQQNQSQAEVEQALAEATLPNILQVEKQALIHAMVELERQEEIQAFIILSAIQQMESQLESLKALLHGDRVLCAKHKLQQLFLTHPEWINILTDDQIHAWQAEAKSVLNPIQ